MYFYCICLFLFCFVCLKVAISFLGFFSCVASYKETTRKAVMCAYMRVHVCVVVMVVVYFKRFEIQYTLPQT